MIDEDSHSGDSESLLYMTNMTIREQNEHLLRENTALKAQFEDAIQITNKVNKITQKNAVLAKENVEIKSEKEELERRLQILMKTNADLTDTIESHKKQYTDRINAENETIQQETSKVAQNYKSQLDNAYGKITDLTKEIEELKVCQKVVNNQIQKLFEAAAFYFKMNFTTVDDFASFLKQIPDISQNKEEKITQSNQVQTQIQSNNPQINFEYEKKIKSLKKKIKARTNACKSAAEDIQELQNSHKKEVSQLKNQIDQIKLEKTETETRLNSTINDLRLKLSKLTNDLSNSTSRNELLKEKLRTKDTFVKHATFDPQLISTQPISSSKKDAKALHSQVEQQRIQIEQSNAEIQHLKEKVDDLKNKLSLADSRKSELQNELHRIESEYQQSQITITKHENELKSLKIVHDEAVSEIESLRKTLHGMPKSSSNKPNSQRQKMIDRESKIIAKKDEEITALHLEIKQGEIKLEEQRIKMNEMKNKISSLEEDLNKVNTNFNDYVVKVEGTYIPTAEELIPPTAFNFSKFEGPLVNEIMKIATNSSLQPSSKLEFCFRAIYKFYKNKIEKLEEDYDQSKNDIVEIKNKVNQFLIDTSIALTGKPISVEEFYNGTESENLLQAISENVSKLAFITRERDQLNSIFTHISSCFGSDDIISTVDSIKNELGTSRVTMQKLAKKCKTLQSENKVLIKKIKNNELNLKSEIDSLSNLNEELERKYKNQNESISKLTKENKRLHADLRNAQEESANSELKNTIDLTTIDEIDEMKSRYTKAINKYKQDIKELSKNIEVLTSNNHVYQNEINRYKQSNQNQQSIIDKLTFENNELKNQVMDHEKRSTAVYELEKTNMKQSYEETVEKLREQNEKGRKDVQKLVKNISARDEKIKEMSTNMRGLLNEKTKLSREITSLKEQLDREKLLSDASVKTQILSLESQYKEQLDEVRRKADTERQSMAAYAANAFRSIINSSSLDEKGYKVIIDRVKDQITKLNASDQAIRKMLNVLNSQTTQDAVAQLMYNSQQ
ncbi:hypothetical protein TRFO_14946 [Tritrichomonas foetus]|uniref:Uncharacterized protein n=1 Tax=Tritrichomonas foetus TaxID=1144522 RepID=A0A1J4KU28_9EUKA|nr:hypothetical protein TRFO_14946 [Tritrichomonas foetus]|eukprot:OHT14642.1 hypothetical protein TRFO_14946 [Tritrichomonas foetus]